MSPTTRRMWTVQVEGSDRVLESMTVPLHRLEERGAKNLVKALVLRYEPLTFVEVVASSLNKRRGGPYRGPIGDPEYFIRPDLAKVGYALHGPTVSAVAWWPMTKGEAKGIETILEQNRNAR